MTPILIIFQNPRYLTKERWFFAVRIFMSFACLSLYLSLYLSLCLSLCLLFGLLICLLILYLTLFLFKATENYLI